MLDEIASKPCIKTQKVIERRKRSNVLNEVKSIEGINTIPQSFLKINPVK